MALDKVVATLAIEIVREVKGHTGSLFDGGECYCRHGNYIGNWAGPDYMCGACEDGVSDYAYALYSAKVQVERDRKWAEREAMRKASDLLLAARVAGMPKGMYQHALITVFGF